MLVLKLILTFFVVYPPVIMIFGAFTGSIGLSSTAMAVIGVLAIIAYFLRLVVFPSSGGRE